MDKIFKNCKRNKRGFAFKEFKDRNGAKCSLQESSLVDPSIWLGVNTKQDEKFKEEFKIIPYTRMHLSYKQVKMLVADLQNWLNENA